MKRLLLLIVLLAACRKEAPPAKPLPPLRIVNGPSAPGVEPHRRIGTRPILQFAQHRGADGGVSETVELSRLAAFSSDGLVFAYTLFSPEAGTSQLHFLAVPTGTEEKTLPLDTQAHRDEALAALEDAGVPPRGHPAPPPSQLGAIVTDGRVVLTFSGAPASKPYLPFGGARVKIDKVEVIAATRDGQHAAVRIIGTPPGGQGGLTEYHLFPLFG